MTNIELAQLVADELPRAHVVDYYDNDGEPTIHISLPCGREFTLTVAELDSEDIR